MFRNEKNKQYFIFQTLGKYFLFGTKPGFLNGGGGEDYKKIVILNVFFREDLPLSFDWNYET